MKITKNFSNFGIAILYVIVVISLGYALSWIVTCGIVKLITLCLGITFKWKIATAVWLILCLLKILFKSKVCKNE